MRYPKVFVDENTYPLKPCKGDSETTEDSIKLPPAHKEHLKHLLSFKCLPPASSSSDIATPSQNCNNVTTTTTAKTNNNNKKEKTGGIASMFAGQAKKIKQENKSNAVPETKVKEMILLT